MFSFFNKNFLSFQKVLISFFFVSLFLFLFSCEPKVESGVIAITIKEAQPIEGREVTATFGSALYGEDEAIPDVSLGQVKIPYIQRIEVARLKGKAFTFRLVGKGFFDVKIDIKSDRKNTSEILSFNGGDIRPTTEIILRKYD